MRGVVFTELIEFVEDNLGLEMADKMIEDAHLENNGAFSQGGNYKFEDLLSLVVSLSKQTGKSIQELLTIFGKDMFAKLVLIYAHDIKDTYATSIDFISNVEGLVHVEVKKLYPDAELPTFTTIEKTADMLVLHYISDKRLEAFAYGLMLGCGEYFQEELSIEYKNISEDPHTIEFVIKL